MKNLECEFRSQGKAADRGNGGLKNIDAVFETKVTGFVAKLPEVDPEVELKPMNTIDRNKPKRRFISISSNYVGVTNASLNP